MAWEVYLPLHDSCQCVRWIDGSRAVIGGRESWLCVDVGRQCVVDGFNLNRVLPRGATRISGIWRMEVQPDNTYVMAIATNVGKVLLVDLRSMGVIHCDGFWYGETSVSFSWYSRLLVSSSGHWKHAAVVRDTRMWKALYCRDREKHGDANDARFCFAMKPHIVAAHRDLWRAEVDCWHAETGVTLFSHLNAHNPLAGSVDGCVFAAGCWKDCMAQLVFMDVSNM